MKRSASIFKDLLSGVPDSRKPRNHFLFWASLLLGAFFLYFALKGLEWSVFFDSLRQANYIYIGFLIIWSSATYFLRGMRWRVLLDVKKNIPPLNVFWANMAGYLGNAILPARAGELVRAMYLARRENIPVTYVLATGVTERLADLAALVIIGAGSLVFVEAFPKSVQDALESFSVIALMGALFIFLLPLFDGVIHRILASLPFPSSSTKSRLQNLFDHFLQGVKVITRVERGVPFLIFTALIWLLDGTGTIMMALALHEKLTLAQSLFFITALGLSSAIPSTPGYVGVYQFVAVIVLVPFGIPRESALALILILQILNLLIVSCWGSIGLWIASQNMVVKGME